MPPSESCSRAGHEAIAAATAIHLRGELRRARERALSDGEGYQPILFAVERLGRQLWWNNRNGLGGFARCFQELVENHHPLAGKSADDYELTFAQRYDIVREARNDAMHIGAEARSLASHCVVLGTVLEDTLMAIACTRRIADYMTRGPVCAHEWQRIALIRQTMLEYSYSCLPYRRECKWHIVSDHDLCEFLQRGGSDGMATRLRMKLCEAIAEGGIKLHKAKDVPPDACVDEVLKDMKRGEPVLVKHPQGEELLGIANAFDLM